MKNLNRNTSLDCLGGVLIIHMICIHMFQRIDVSFGIFVRYQSIALFFFMAWFFFKSGMFAKEYTVSVLLKKYTSKLLKPYLFYTIVGILVGMVYNIALNNPLLPYLKTECLSYWIANLSVDGNLPLWFLPSLFAVILTYNCFLKADLSLIVGIVLSLVLFLVIAMIKWTIKNEGGTFILPYIFLNGLCGLFFFFCGKLLREIQYKNIIVVLSAVIYLTALLFPIKFDFRTCMVDEPYQLVQYVICGLSAIILFDNIFKYIPERIKLPFSYVGRNSMLFFLTHWLFIDLARLVGVMLHLEKFVVLTLAVLYMLVGTQVLILIKRKKYKPSDL